MGNDLTVAEALSNFRKANGLHAASSSSWSCRIGPITLQLPNFQWRREAILQHDLHHILIGYPCTMRGEFQMAAWEFAAGRFRHPAATLFCLPLVAAGYLWSPRSIWRAFLSGRQGRSLYETEMTEAFLRSSIGLLRADPPLEPRQKVRLADFIAFCSLMVVANSTVLVPISAVAAFVMAIWSATGSP